ncbi:MAG: PAS domain-containing protein [Rubrivivax sp.]
MTPDPRSAIERSLCAEQTRLHGRVMTLSLTLSTLLAVVLYGSLHGRVDAVALHLWLALALLSAGARLGLHLAQRAPAAADAANPRWRRRYRLALLAQGLAWASAGIMLFLLPADRQHDLLVFSLAGLSAGALLSHGFDRQGALLYAGPLLLPLLLYGALRPHGELPQSLVIVSLLMPIGVLTMLRLRRTMVEAVATQVAQEQRADELRRAAALVDRTGAIAGVGGWEVDAATRQVTLSPHAARLLELAPQAPLRLDQLVALVDPEARAGIARDLDALLAGGAPLSAEVPLRTASGRLLRMRLEAQARLADGRVAGVDGALQDVTRLHAMDRALADKHRLLEQLMQTSRQGLWFFDRDGRCTDLNPAMATLLGRPREQLLGRPAADFVAPDARDALAAALLGEASAAGDGIEAGFERPDGAPLRCLVHASRLTDSDGQVVGSVAVCTDITRRFEAEQALRISQIVINASAEMISVLDEHNVYHMVNDAWCRSTGLRREQVIGRHAGDVMPQNVSAERLQALRSCVDESRRATVRAVASFPGLGQRTLHSDFYPIRVDAGGPRLVALVTRDVTQEEQQRAALVSAAEFLRGTLDATGDAIFATDASSEDDPPRFANDQLFLLWRIPDAFRAAPTVRQIGEAMYAWALDPVAERARVDALVAAGEAAQDRIVLRDGRVLVRRFAPVPLHGRLLRVWSFREITAEVRAVEAREAVAAEQRALFDNFPGYIAVLDEQQRYRHVNDALATLLRRRPDELIGRRPAEVLGDYAWRKLQHYLDRALQSGRATSESHYDKADGSGAVDLEVTHVAGTPQADGSRAIYTFGIDVTERKRAQAALIDALAEAERANTAKSRFLSHMSHELRTPLNAVLGFGQLLGAQPLAPAQQHQVGEILRGGRHLLALINDLLDLGRIEAGAFEVVCQALDAEAALDEAVGLLAPLADERAVSLRQLPPEQPLPALWADPKRLRQVLLNLLSSAIKHNPRGGAVVAELALLGSEIEFRVRDDGPGLTPDEQQRLFRPFERVRPDADGADGTGIGLALSRNLVEAMGGHIGVHSRPGQGSCFWVRLASAGPLPASVPPAAPDSPAGAPAAPRRARALYIEDNPVNLMLMAAMLEDELDLTGEADPVRGLELALTQVPDLILLDIQLPGMDGYEVLRRLRADARTRHLPVVAVSANAMPGDVAAGKSAGFDAYVTKPVDLDVLLHTVRAVLQTAPSAAGH